MAGRIMGCHQQFSAARHRRAYRFKTTAMPFISLQTRTVMGTSTISLFMHADKLAQKGWIWALRKLSYKLWMHSVISARSATNLTFDSSYWVSAINTTGKMRRSFVGRGIGDPTPRLSHHVTK